MELEDLEKRIRSETGQVRHTSKASDQADSNVLPCIPVPGPARWREVRLRLVPVLIFLASTYGALWLWQQQGAQSVFLGSAEGRYAVVSAPIAGALQVLSVTNYQFVRQGDTIAVVNPLEARTQISLLQLKLQTVTRRFEPSIAQRTAVDYQRLKADVLSLKVEIAKDREELNHAEIELKRDEELFRQKLLSEESYDLALKRRDALRAEVQAKNKAIAELEEGLKRVESMTFTEDEDPAEERRRAAEMKELDKLLQSINLGPVTLAAPMSGMISIIHRGQGENVKDGEAVVTIQAAHADRIVGYIRQPFPFEPEIGQKVEVRTRELKPQAAMTTITQVGGALEPITMTMQRPGTTTDLGLPIVLGLPPGLVTRPGELFDLTAFPASKSAHQ